MDELILFYSLAILVTLSSIGVVCAKSPLTAVTRLIFCLLSLSGLYAMQGSYFIATIQIVICAGALLGLLLFVVLFLKLKPKTLSYSPRKCLAMLLGTTITLSILFVSLKDFHSVPTEKKTLTENSYDINIQLFGHYLWLLGLGSIVILLASISSVVITRKTTLLKKK